MATVSRPSKASEAFASGADVVVESLVRHGVDVIFAYPGGASMPLHQALTRYKDQIRTILPRHEQGGAFAAQGYARTTGKPGVCMGTSGPGALNLVTAIADAKLDSIPLVVLSGQVGTSVIGTDAFQETPMVEVCRGITKHHYLVTDANDIARVMKEAFHIATTGRPGPVLVDLPKNIQLTQIVPDYDCPMNLPGYKPEQRKSAPAEQIAQVVAAIKRAKKPVIYAGGGVIASDASEELRALARKTGIPVTMTLMGLGAYPGDDPLSLDMLGMHGSVYANYAVDEADLLLAIGVRFDDRVTGKVEAFAEHGFIVHIDIDPSEINKNKVVHVPIVADVKTALGQLNAIVERPAADLAPWHAQIAEWKKEDPYSFDTSYPGILAQEAIQALSRLTGTRDTVISVGVGQHQMWAAQFLRNGPRRWISSAGLGTMGFGMPAAMGVQTAFPDERVICVAGDASILMNIQELGTLSQYQLPVKVVVLNNGWQGMVRQWQESFYEERYSSSEMTGGMPDFPALAEAFGVKGIGITDRAQLRSGLAEALAHPGPVFVDVRVRRNENCYPMVPPGASNAQMVGLPSHPELAIDTIRQCNACGSTTASAHLFCPSCGAKL
jgi:acetolactate synthase-1/2/3 large subunit